MAMALESAMSLRAARAKARGRLSLQSQSSRTSGAEVMALEIRRAISFVSGTRCAIKGAS